MSVFAVLRSYFGLVDVLSTYLSQILDITPGSCVLIQESDPQSYKVFLLSSYVACETPYSLGSQPRFKRYPPLVYMSELIDRAQEKLFIKSKGKRPVNMLTNGYKLSSGNGESGRANSGRIAITHCFVNTIVTALQSPEWEMLLQRIGDGAMFHLLTETSIFVPLPNDCLCQVTGQPIHLKKVPQLWTRMMSPKDPASCTSHKRRAPTSHPEQRPSKRRCLDQSSNAASARSRKGASSDTTDDVRTSADISFVRVRMFYSRPKYVPHSSNIVTGLPPQHVLNRIAPSYTCSEQYTQVQSALANPRKRTDDARHLAKYVLPRQYGLSSAFSNAGGSKHQSSRLPDFTSREWEIKMRGSMKSPRRVKAVLPLLEQIIWRHVKCRYKRLCDAVCPSKLSTTPSKNIDSSIILELMSEHGSQPKSQISQYNKSVSLDILDRSIVSHALSQAGKGAKHKPRFAEFACSQLEVYRYAILVTRAVIPHAFWGSQKNFHVIAQYVKEFICCRRYETLTLHHVQQGFSISDCDWLLPGEQEQSRVTMCDDLKRRELLGDFLYWYFDSFLLQLLQTTFYITESSAFRKQILYFRQDDWHVLCKPLIDRLASETFQKIDATDAEEFLRQRRLGFSFVRLLPKDTGVRPIVNLRRKAPQKGSFGRVQSINQILQATFNILSYERDAQASMLGCSVFGPNEIYARLKDYKLRLKSSSPAGVLPKLYFVKTDVQACFDTIDQSKLLAILRRLISEEAYMIQRYAQVSVNSGKVKRLYVRKAIPEDEHPHFLKVAQKLADALRRTIFVDQVEYTFTDKEDVMALLEEHITENIVKIGAHYYRQVVGIPQGSVLSTLLCSFFYGDLEQRKFSFSDDPESVLLRLIDDYLFITIDLAKAEHFLQLMSEGHPEYGCFISPDKTLTNFHCGSYTTATVKTGQRGFPWCGYLVDMNDLSVSADYSRYHDTYLQDSLTVEKARRPGITFVQKMTQLAKHKSHIIFCDANLNSERVVYLNVYQNFLVTAMKMHHYVRSLALDVRRKTKFLHSSIKQILQSTHAAIRNKATNKVAQSNGAICKVDKKVVLFLGTHAFHLVLSCKPEVYSRLVKLLAFELSLPKNRILQSRYRSVLAEGQATVTQLSF